MAISFLELKRPDEAEASARRPRQARPQHGGAHNTMGEILYARQDYRAALGHFVSAAVLDPYPPSNTYNVAVTYERPGNTPEACRHWRRYIALEMRDALYQYNRDAALSRPLDIHIGISSGPVVAGIVGGAAKRERYNRRI